MFELEKEGLGRKPIQYNLLCIWQRFSLINWFSLFSTQLLAPEIRHERNVILQCLRHIVKRNFFDVGDINLPPKTSVQNEICDEFVNESWKINFRWQQQLLEWSYCTINNYFFMIHQTFILHLLMIGLNMSCEMLQLPGGLGLCIWKGLDACLKILN